jgi:hypothetical protein
MKPLTIICMLLLSAVHVTQGEEPDPLAPLRFLLGEWQAIDGSSSSNAAGRYTFSETLHGRLISRTSWAEYPARNGRPASRHDDFMTIYVEADSMLKADYYDNEGHIIRYAVHVLADRNVEFVSLSNGTSPQYRLSYSLKHDGVLTGRFEIAPPGKPDAFSTYLSWSSKKVVPPR